MRSATFLGRLYRKNKWLCAGVTAFFAIAIAANCIIRLETTPFMVWNMYARREQPQKEFVIYEVRYDGQLLDIPHTWQEPRKMMLFDPLRYYLETRPESGATDSFRLYMEDHWIKKHPAFRQIAARLCIPPESFAAFPAWYKAYLAQQTGPIHSIDVIRKRLSFAENGFVTMTASDTVLKIR